MKVEILRNNELIAGPIKWDASRVRDIIMRQGGDYRLIPNGLVSAIHIGPLAVLPVKHDKPQLTITQAYGSPERTVTDESVIYAYPVVERDPADVLIEVKTRQRDRINSARDAALADGLPYTMPDGTDDVIQMQADDRQNLMGLAIDARDLVAADETGAVQEFRAKSNTRYSLTPAQMIDLTNAALVHYKGVMAQSWDRKDAIEAVELGDYPSLDDAVAAIEAIGWE